MGAQQVGMHDRGHEMNSSMGMGVSTGDIGTGARIGTGTERFARHDRFLVSFGGLSTPGFRPTPAHLAGHRNTAQSVVRRGRRQPLTEFLALKRITRQVRGVLRTRTASPAAEPVPAGAPALRLVRNPPASPASAAQPAASPRPLPTQSLQTEDGSAATTGRGAARAARRLRLAGDDG
jgi:hypothetical protein